MSSCKAGIYARKLTIGGTWPGFDDQLEPWTENRYISRQNGLVYNKTWALARQNHVPVIMIATWNDFEEGTDIEFGVRMTVDMEDPDPALLIRSSPLTVTWNPDRGEAVVQVYQGGTLIYDQAHSSGVSLELESQLTYEIKIWVSGSPEVIAKWVKIRSYDS